MTTGAAGRLREVLLSITVTAQAPFTPGPDGGVMAAVAALARGVLLNTVKPGKLRGFVTSRARWGIRGSRRAVRTMAVGASRGEAPMRSLSLLRMTRRAGRADAARVGLMAAPAISVAIGRRALLLLMAIAASDGDPSPVRLVAARARLVPEIDELGAIGMARRAARDAQLRAVRQPGVATLARAMTDDALHACELGAVAALTGAMIR